MTFKFDKIDIELFLFLWWFCILYDAMCYFESKLCF